MASSPPSMDALITSGAATDGSILLSGFDDSGAPLTVALDATFSLSVNGERVLMGSPEEVRWLEALMTAQVQHAPSSETLPVMSVAGAELLNPTPNEALAALVVQVVTLVTSEAAHAQPRPAPSQAIADEILELLLDGDDAGAVRVYRQAHPELGLAEAEAAVDVMKTQ